MRINISETLDAEYYEGLEIIRRSIARTVGLPPEVAEEIGLTTETAKLPKPEEKESVEDIKKRARKPPKDGPCRGCGKDLPLNRLMLCYRCWVNKVNSDKGWREGQPHPAGCGCDLDCRYDKVGKEEN